MKLLRVVKSMVSKMEKVRIGRRGRGILTNIFLSISFGWTGIIRTLSWLSIAKFRISVTTFCRRPPIKKKYYISTFDPEKRVTLSNILPSFHFDFELVYPSLSIIIPFHLHFQADQIHRYGCSSRLFPISPASLATDKTNHPSTTTRSIQLIPELTSTTTTTQIRRIMDSAYRRCSRPRRCRRLLLLQTIRLCGWHGPCQCIPRRPGKERC